MFSTGVNELLYFEGFKWAEWMYPFRMFCIKRMIIKCLKVLSIENEPLPIEGFQCEQWINKEIVLSGMNDPEILEGFIISWVIPVVESFNIWSEHSQQKGFRLFERISYTRRFWKAWMNASHVNVFSTENESCVHDGFKHLEWLLCVGKFCSNHNESNLSESLIIPEWI